MLIKTLISQIVPLSFSFLPRLSIKQIIHFMDNCHAGRLTKNGAFSSICNFFKVNSDNLIMAYKKI